MTAVQTATTPAPRRVSGDLAVLRWIAMIAGALGVVLAIATPLLPVVQTTATLNWPQGGQFGNVTAPLISQAPVSMDVTVPCDVIRGMPPAGGLVLGTAPAKGKDAALNALFVNVTPARVDITEKIIRVMNTIQPTRSKFWIRWPKLICWSASALLPPAAGWVVGCCSMTLTFVEWKNMQDSDNCRA